MTDISADHAFRPPVDWEAEFAGNSGNARMGSEPSAIARSAMHYLRAFGIDPAEAVALDLGCGEGRDTLFFASAGMRVVARDAAPTGIRRTREAAERMGVGDRVDAAVMDVRQFDYPENAFDLSMAANVFQFLPQGDAHAGIAGLQRAARPGGIVAVGVFSPVMAGWGTDISPYFTATADDLMALFPASAGGLLCDRTEYWTYRVADDTMGSFSFVVYRKRPDAG